MGNGACDRLRAQSAGPAVLMIRRDLISEPEVFRAGRTGRFNEVVAQIRPDQWDMAIPGQLRRARHR